MAEKRDYYEVLGVERGAGDDDIRKAYRKLALQHHPDRNPGDTAAETRFKEATEAYSVLNDKEKRATYDRFGHAGLGGGVDFSGAGVGDILSHFQDLFADFFGGGEPGGGRGRRASNQGADVRVDATVTLEEAMTGAKKEIAFKGVAPCEDCRGSGAQAGTKPQSCPQCGGSGQIGTQRGFIMFATTCHRCRGTGQIVSNPCAKCHGGGAVERSRKVVVSFPPGIDSGQRIRVKGQGMPGPGGQHAGDLYVDVELEPHARFERQGYDLITRERLSFAQCALGSEITLELPDGQTLSAAVPPGTQPGGVITVQGRGVPHVDRRARGNVHVLVEVEVPRKLSKRAKQLLEQLEEELGPASEPPKAAAR